MGQFSEYLMVCAVDIEIRVIRLERAEEDGLLQLGNQLGIRGSAFLESFLLEKLRIS